MVHLDHCPPSSQRPSPSCADRSLRGSEAVDKDRIEGSAKAAKGSIKEAVGKIVGSKTTQAEGAAEKAAGKAQETVGKGKDAVRDAAKK